MSKHNGRIHPEDEYMDDHSRSRTIIRERSGVGPFIMGALIGGAIGAAIALMYAPAEGTEIRQGINDAIEDITDGAKEIVRGVKSTAEKIFTEGMPDDEDDTPLARARERADDILEDADRAIAEARRRTGAVRTRRQEQDEDEE